MPGKQVLTTIVAGKPRTYESPWRESLGEEISFHLKIEKWPEAGQIEIRQGSDRSNTISKLIDMIFKIWMVF